MTGSVDAKRAFDIAVSGSLIVLLSPVLAAVGALIKRDDPHSPILFTQERVGMGGIPFRIHKFRTMRPGSFGPQVTSGGIPGSPALVRCSVRPNSTNYRSCGTSCGGT